MITPEALGRALGLAPNPEMARVALSRIESRPGGKEPLAEPEVLEPAARLLGFSTAAADFFAAHPEQLKALADPRFRAIDELLSEARTDVSDLGPSTGLRVFRRRAGYRVAARDLGGALVEDVMAELSDIAEACLAMAVESVGGARLAVIGMGKLGGKELNYSSDVDVLFVHDETGAGRQEGASRLAAQVIRLLREATEEGICLRVDANLRPEGRAGPLSRSIESMLGYHERHAATWERQALLKSRAVAGDMALGAEFVERVAPFVYPAVLPASAIEDVRSSKARIEESVRAVGKDQVELKRGRGGIRDVEFAVQLLQLVHGRRHPSLRLAGTLDALDALGAEGLVATEDAGALAASYRFLRRLEHRLQMARDLQTHELPSSPGTLGPLARSMGLQSAESLRLEHARHTETVRGLHERLFYRPLLEAFAGPPVPSPGTDREATEELLAGLGFADPAAAYEAFDRAFDEGARLGKVLASLFPVIAPELAFSPAPDVALVRFQRVAERLREDASIADALADRPDAARRLAALMASSAVFADSLVANPGSVRALFELPREERPLFAPDPQAEILRVAAACATRELTVPETGRRLAAVADAVIERAIQADPPPLPLAVIALGKLGGEELSFASDLDLAFVYEGEGPTAFEEAARAAERILAGVVTAGWKADADLRPEGRSGPLARSMASYLEYWERWAETWEYQTLLRARFVAGDEILGRRFLSNAADFAYPESLTFEQVAGIRRMRVRMEQERVRPPEARRFHFKLGYGGLADVQFAVELSMMRHGFAHPEVRRGHTLEALEELASSRLLEGSVALSLSEGYTFLTEIKTALEMESRVPAEALPPTPEAQAALARRLGYGERARHRFLQDYRRITRKVRMAMERVFYGEEPEPGP